ATDERRGLVQLDRITEACLPRRFVRTELGAPRAPAGFDAQRVDRIVAGVLEAEFQTHGPERVIERQAKIGENGQLVTRNTDVAHARGTNACVADVDLATP